MAVLAWLERWLLSIAYSRRVLPPIAGGSGEGDGDGDGGDGGDGSGDGDGGGDGDAGDGDGKGDGEGVKALLEALPEDQREKVKKALESERASAAQARKDAKAAKRELKKITADVEALKAGAATDEEKKIAEAKTEAAKEARAKLERPIKRNAVRAAAAGRMNPAIAVRLVDLEEIEVDEDGEVDEATVRDAIDTLLAESPELALKAGGKKSGSDTTNGSSPKDQAPDINDLLRAAARGK